MLGRLVSAPTLGGVPIEDYVGFVGRTGLLAFLRASDRPVRNLSTDIEPSDPSGTRSHPAGSRAIRSGGGRDSASFWVFGHYR